MSHSISKQGGKSEDLLGELAEAARLATGRQGLKGAFIDVELDLWQAVQARLRRSMGGPMTGSALFESNIHDA